MSNDAPVQNSSVDTTCAPGIIRARVDFPAPPWPPIPTRTTPSRPRAAAIRSSTGRGSIAARYPQSMEKLRLGGMALSNGVLVHGPTSWGAAVRVADGTIRSAAGPKRRFAENVTTPFIRGPLRLAEAFALLPDVRRALPEARFPFERPRVAVAVLAGAAAAGMARRSNLNLAAREAIAGLASLAPAALALRGGEVASYHGAEHISIGTYETGEQATKEHDRCGGHLVGPLLLTSAAASALAARAPARMRPAARTAGVDRCCRCRRRGLRLDGEAPWSSFLPRPGAARAGVADARIDRGADRRPNSRSPKRHSPRVSAPRRARDVAPAAGVSPGRVSDTASWRRRRSSRERSRLPSRSGSRSRVERRTAPSCMSSRPAEESAGWPRSAPAPGSVQPGSSRRCLRKRRSSPPSSTPGSPRRWLFCTRTTRT